MNMKDELAGLSKKTQMETPKLFVEIVQADLKDRALNGHEYWEERLSRLADPFQKIKELPNFCDYVSELLGGCSVYFEFRAFHGEYIVIEWFDEEPEAGNDDE